MIKLGILGGMGPQSTLDYYKRIVYLYQEKKGYEIFPAVTIESIDIFAMLKLCKAEEYDELTEMLITGIYNLFKAGATVGIIAANTPHIVFDRLKEKSPIPLISIIDATVEEVQNHQQHKVGLLGTEFTLKKDFFKKPFRKNNIEIIIPDTPDVTKINNYIVSELEQGIVKTSTRDYLLSVIQKMQRKDNIQGVILGCTEFSLILNQKNIDITVYDTTSIHVERAVHEIISE